MLEFGEDQCLLCLQVDFPAEKKLNFEFLNQMVKFFGAKSLSR